MGLSAFEASLVIAEVQYGATSDSPIAGGSSRVSPRSWRRTALRWGATLLALAAIMTILRLQA